MCQLRWQAALFAYADGLFDRGEEFEAFLAHVTDVETAKTCSDPREGDDLFGRRVGAGHVLEPGRQAERPFAHRLFDEPLHRLELVFRRRPVLVAHHLTADRAVADGEPEVDRRRMEVDARQEIANRKRRTPIRPLDDRRYALADVVLGQRMPEHAPHGVAVDVDETWSDRESAQVEAFGGSRVVEVTDRCDPVSLNADIGAVGLAATAVVDRPAFEQQVIARPVGGLTEADSGG